MQILTRLNKVIAYSVHGYVPVGNSAICTMSNECYDNATIITVDSVPTDIDGYEYHYINGRFVKGDTKSELVETNNYNRVRIWVGTHAEYDALRDEDKVNLFAIIMDDTSEESLQNAIERVASTLESTKSDLVSGNIKVGNALNADSANIATNDTDGNNISNTYSKISNGYTLHEEEIDVSGGIIITRKYATLKKGSFVTYMTEDNLRIGHIINRETWGIDEGLIYMYATGDGEHKITSDGIVCGCCSLLTDDLKFYIVQIL